MASVVTEVPCVRVYIHVYIYLCTCVPLSVRIICLLKYENYGLLNSDVMQLCGQVTTCRRNLLYPTSDYPEDGLCIFLQKRRYDLSDYMAAHPRGQKFS